MQMSFDNSVMLLVSSMLRLHFAPRWWELDLHLLQVFVGGVLVAMVLHLAEVALFGGQHWVNLSQGW